MPLPPATLPGCAAAAASQPACKPSHHATACTAAALQGGPDADMDGDSDTDDTMMAASGTAGEPPERRCRA